MTVKAFALFEMLLYRSTGERISIAHGEIGTFPRRDETLTAWNDDPNEVHEEIITPKVIRFWSAVRKALVVVVEHACGVVEYITIDLAQRDQGLERMTERMIIGYHQCDSEG